MNPYGPMFSGIVDNVIMFAITAAIVCVGAIYFPRNWFYGRVNPGSETYYTAFAYALLSLHAFIASLQLVGLVGMFFGVVSVLWSFWQPLDLLSIGMVFRHFPILTFVAFVWSVVGWWRLQYPAHAILLSVLLSLALAVNAGLHFAIWACARN